MKNKTVKALALAMAVATVTMMGSASIYASDDTAEAATEETADTEEDADAADHLKIQKHIAPSIRQNTNFTIH